MKTHEHRPQQLNKQPASAGTMGEKGHCRLVGLVLLYVHRGDLAY